MAYRGYMIKLHPMRGTYMIEKDGAFIGWAKSEREARATVDMLTEGA